MGGTVAIVLSFPSRLRDEGLGVGDGCESAGGGNEQDRAGVPDWQRGWAGGGERWWACDGPGVGE